MDKFVRQINGIATSRWSRNLWSQLRWNNSHPYHSTKNTLNSLSYIQRPSHELGRSFSSISNGFNTSGGKKPQISQAPAPPPKNVTIRTFYQKKLQGNQITMVTAYDFPSAVHCDVAGIDAVLVGDSVGMVELGQVHMPMTFFVCYFFINLRFLEYNTWSYA